MGFTFSTLLDLLSCNEACGLVIGEQPIVQRFCHLGDERLILVTGTGSIHPTKGGVIGVEDLIYRDENRRSWSLFMTCHENVSFLTAGNKGTYVLIDRSERPTLMRKSGSSWMVDDGRERPAVLSRLTRPSYPSGQ
jgi:hypothetical protein